MPHKITDLPLIHVLHPRQWVVRNKRGRSIRALYLYAIELKLHGSKV